MNLARCFLAAAFFFPFCAAQAQPTLRMLSAFPPGGAADSVARLFAETLGQAIGQPVVVETRTGATGQVALTALKASAPDGNTLMVASHITLTLSPHTVKTPYDTLKDFVPVAHIGSFNWGLAVGASVPTNDFREWVKWTKADKKNATYGSTGLVGQYLGLMIAQEIGIQLLDVPYRGGPLAIVDLLGGQVPSVLIPLGTLVPHARAGKLRVLAQAGDRRASVAPEVPTFKELGYSKLVIASWYCIIVPAGIRPELVARYNEIVIQAERTAAVRDRMRALDLEIYEMAPAEVAAKLKAEYDQWGAIVKASGTRGTP